MLPPVDTHVLAANPKFAALYCDLCANKLDADGTSKLDARSQKDHDALQDELRRARLESAKRDIIQQCLRDLAYRDEELPNDLRELVTLAAATLGGEIAHDDQELVNSELERFDAYILPVRTAISRRLNQDATALGQLFPKLSRTQGAASGIALAVQQLQASATTSQVELAHSRLALAQDTQQLHTLYRQLSELCIRILEQAIHGSVARGTKAKADYLATMAEGMSKKLGVQHAQLMQQVYSPEMQTALKARSDDMQAQTISVREEIREAEGRLEKYRTARGISGMVKEYAEILSESEKIKDGITRLETR
ncbi:hypothetical protein LTR53_015180 [Teratosphaeriaceae sp. CCFEE 6253]|nr:hypothetical protein LTR53_015180 [Teratosphaeriaceae sp. CCFEE 6253]